MEFVLLVGFLGGVVVLRERGRTFTVFIGNRVESDASTKLPIPWHKS